MIKIFVPFSDRLNLNGDAANALILSKRLKWAGIDSLTVELNHENDIDSAIHDVERSGQKSFVLVGHGSIAAMKSILLHQTRIASLISAVKEKDGCGLVVGSSYELLSDHKVGERISEFRSADLVLPDGSRSVQVVGYVNSSANLPDCHWDESVLFTRMHGPVLAKSTGLADYFIANLTGFEPTSNLMTQKIDAFVAEAIAVARGERN